MIDGVLRRRPLGQTGLEVSEVAFGTWQLGGDWGDVPEADGAAGLHAALDAGVDLFDTADVYGRGRSEELLGRVLGDRPDVIVATKFGRWDDFTHPSAYTEPRVRAYCEASLRRLRREAIDLYQVHTPTTEAIERGEVFESLRTLQREGKVRHFGVSVETAAQGRLALRHEGVAALQVIFNIFRQNLVDELFPDVEAAGAGVLARVPLASGLLTGKFTKETRFAPDDHRRYNREGASFNVGETFAGVPFELGVELAGELSWIADGRETMAAAALRFVLDHPQVSCVIPGFKDVRQVEQDLAAARVAPFSRGELDRLASFFTERVRPHVKGEL
jgi:aryl-alcohol dehydrogenase-like predicted oxidoreductase